jgi:hypothetical protein
MSINLSDREKQFYSNMAKGSALLSFCGFQRGAVLITTGRNATHGYNRPLIKGVKIDGQDIEVSAIYDAIFSSRDLDLNGSTVFSTHFPTVDDLKLMVSVGVNTIYFFGQINDAHTVMVLNEMAGVMTVIQLQ